MGAPVECLGPLVVDQVAWGDCAPGRGQHPGQSLEESLQRQAGEEGPQRAGLTGRLTPLIQESNPREKQWDWLIWGHAPTLWPVARGPGEPCTWTDSPTRLHRGRGAGFPKDQDQGKGSGGRAGETCRRPVRCPGPALAVAKSAAGLADHPSVPLPGGGALPVHLFEGVRGLTLTLAYLWASRGTRGWM